MNLFGRKDKKTLEPLEIKQKILSRIDDEIVAVGGGQRRFPHAGIEICFFAADEAAKGKFRVAFVENSTLEKAIRDYLQPPRCTEAKPDVEIKFIEEVDENFDKNGFQIKFLAEKSNQPATDFEAYLEVLEGLTNRKQMRLVNDLTYIGRCETTRRKDGQIVRANDLYFLDARELSGTIPKELKENERINQSVSRIHAHIRFNAGDGNYYIYDDESRKGTSILRGGRGAAENVDRSAGKELKNGDMIFFGKARVKFRLVKKPESKARESLNQPE